jgi:hypothetical protein
MLRADPIHCGSLKLSRIQPALSPPPRFGCGRPRCVHLVASAQDLFVAARNTNSRGTSEAIGSLSQERGVTQMQADGPQCTQISRSDPDPLPLSSCARWLRHRVRNLVAANSRAAFNCTAKGSRRNKRVAGGAHRFQRVMVRAGVPSRLCSCGTEVADGRPAPIGANLRPRTEETPPVSCPTKVGHPRLFRGKPGKDVDGRDKRGHDTERNPRLVP